MPARWGELTTREVLDAVDGTVVYGLSRAAFTGISTDSRRIISGGLFWALTGNRHDGHQFVFDTLQKGAMGAVVSKRWWEAEGARRAADHEIPEDGPDFIAVDDTLQALGDFGAWWRRQHRAKVVGITGSSGKTTTKEMVAGVFGVRHKTLKNEGNFNNLIGLPLTLLRLTDGHDRAVLEMGMNRPGEIGRLTNIAAPDIGAIINIGRAHLEGLVNLDGVARAKCEMIHEMPPSGLMVLNGDDVRLMKAAGQGDLRKLTFGYKMENDVRATGIQELGKEGVRFTLVYDHDAWPARLRIPGRHNVSNALAAAAVGFGMGEDPETIINGLAAYPGMDGRFMIRTFPGGVTLVDDTYNANPSSLKAALDAIQSLVGEGEKLIVSLGDMLELGEAAIRSHREAGRWVSESGAGFFFALGAHNTEMKAGALEGGMPEEKVIAVSDHDEMIRLIANAAKGGAIVLVKGSRGMQLEKVVEGLGDILTRRPN